MAKYEFAMIIYHCTWFLLFFFFFEFVSFLLILLLWLKFKVSDDQQLENISKIAIQIDGCCTAD